MHRIEIARYLATRINGSASGMAQNTIDTLRALADKVEALEHSMQRINEDCMRLALERDEARQALLECQEKWNDRRVTPRPKKTH
jgi:branched-subunit amino acid aminotransferase/4-amino-4-deoxychorismate lyase